MPFSRARLRSFLSVLLLASAPAFAQVPATEEIPLPEHPRPDFERPDWLNLNGPWAFRSDSTDAGLRERWADGAADGEAAGAGGFPERITVPFSWGSPLSGVEDEADIGWYARTVEVPARWDGRRVFLVIGASDWRTTAWLDGEELGTQQGGYTPFAFELTPHVRPGDRHRLVMRVDDTPHGYRLEGKQGYGNARGIWQTPYLEARGDAALEWVHFTPDIHEGRVTVEARLLEPAPSDLTLRLTFRTGGLPEATHRVPRGAREARFDVPVPGARLWSLDDPFLYDVIARLEGAAHPDVVSTYFGMREISVVDLPGTDHRYVALNGRPVYLQLALDQAYHPEGFYTFPSDEALRDEVLRARQIGLNGLREHVKIESPRKLYWADRLGMLVMADVPNWWGLPSDTAFAEHDHALRGMVARDYNHPSIFSWIPFNETWGLYTETGVDEEGEDVWEYLPETQRRVAAIYRLTRSLDPSRLVEDNSVCCGRGHTETDLNTWHAYLPGDAWDAELDSVSAGAFPGSQWNFEAGFSQGRQPLINSEFGNVWGYEGSTGDVDFSWDYHRALDAFRRHPRVAGWLYTEHHDVVNEWNGYWRYDRSEKESGLGELVEGMSLRDLHGPFYIAAGEDVSREAAGGETVQVPLWASFLTDTQAHGDTLFLETELYGWDALGERRTYGTARRAVPYRPWMSEALAPLPVTMPDGPAVAVLALRLVSATGEVLHRNLTTFVVTGEPPDEVRLADGRTARLVRVTPGAFSDAQWSLRQWNVLDGLKVNGAGAGFFEYRYPWPGGLDAADVEAATFLVEASSRPLLGRDRPDAGTGEGDFMRGGGTYDPGLNPNAYPMTDETRFPSAVTVRVGGHVAARHELADDPADHRGILSWHSQLDDGHLREAGTYGELLRVAIPRAALDEAAARVELVIRLEVDEALPGGLAIYGARFGRFPLDPTVVFLLAADAPPSADGH
jgi:hypothetical protein